MKGARERSRALVIWRAGSRAETCEGSVANQPSCRKRRWQQRWQTGKGVPGCSHGAPLAKQALYLLYLHLVALRQRIQLAEHRGQD